MITTSLITNYTHTSYYNIFLILYITFPCFLKFYNCRSVPFNPNHLFHALLAFQLTNTQTLHIPFLLLSLLGFLLLLLLLPLFPLLLLSVKLISLVYLLRLLQSAHYHSMITSPFLKISFLELIIIFICTIFYLILLIFHIISPWISLFPLKF